MSGDSREERKRCRPGRVPRVGGRLAHVALDVRGQRKIGEEEEDGEGVLRKAEWVGEVGRWVVVVDGEWVVSPEPLE